LEVENSSESACERTLEEEWMRRTGGMRFILECSLHLNPFDNSELLTHGFSLRLKIRL